MTFSEIKPKIKNLGKYKTLEEIKRAGLRIVKNSKTGAYWLIEEEFLKPVIKSPRECKTIVVNPKDLKFKIFMVHKDRKDLRNSKVMKYIKWGESRGFNKRPTCASRQKWWDLGEWNKPDFIWSDAYNIRYGVYDTRKNLGDKRFFYITLQGQRYFDLIKGYLNSTIISLLIEIEGITNLGEGAIYTNVYWLQTLLVPHKIGKTFLDKIRKALDELEKREILSIFEELGAKNSKEVSLDKIKSDRRELDKIVMGEILGLTDEEQLEIYQAVIDLVKSRIEKAKSLGKNKKTKAGINIDALANIVLEKIGKNTLKKFYKEKILKQENLIAKKLPELKDKIEIKKGLFAWQIISGKNSIDCRSKSEAHYLEIWLEVGVKSIKIPKDEKYLDKIIDEFKMLKSNIDEIIENYLGSILERKIKNQILYQIWQRII